MQTQVDHYVELILNCCNNNHVYIGFDLNCLDFFETLVDEIQKNHNVDLRIELIDNMSNEEIIKSYQKYEKEDYDIIILKSTDNVNLTDENDIKSDFIGENDNKNIIYCVIPTKAWCDKLMPDIYKNYETLFDFIIDNYSNIHKNEKTKKYIISKE